MSSLVWEEHPTLHRPVLVAGFTGWNDAGDAASDAATWLANHFDAQRFAFVDPEEHVDFQAVRPTVELVDGVTREIRWPTTQCAAAKIPGSSRDLIVVTGAEPNFRWKAFCESIVEVASVMGCDMIVTLGALLADVPHSRPVRVTGATGDERLMDRLGLSRSRYEGPTGIVGVLQDACRAAGYPSVSLWAPVPHYVTTPPNPPAIGALLDRFAALTGIHVELGELRVASEAWRARVDAAIAGDDDLRGYVRGLEEQADDEPALETPTGELPSGDELARAFEEYLRDQGSD
jgi:proteasome assembly chaperone (PAC2) family protein